MSAVRAALFVLFLAAGVRAEEATAILRWRTGTVAQQLPRRLPLLTEAPAGLTLSDESLEGVAYAQMPLGDKAKLTILVAVDAFWIDRDLDGDLKEEPATKWFGPPDKRYRNVHLEVPFAGVLEPVTIQVLVVFKPEAKPARIEVTARAYRRGKVVLAGRERLVVLYDNDGDLRFDQPDKDMLFLDLDGNGKLKGGDRSPEELRAGIPFRLKGRGFIATVPDTGGGRVVFKEIEEAPPPPRRPWTARYRPRAGIRASGRGNLKKMAAAYQAAADKSSVPWARIRAVQQMGGVGTREAFALLWRIYRRDESVEVRALAVRQMGYMQYVEHAANVAKVALQKEPKLKVAAIEALHGMGAPDRGQTYAKLLFRVKDEQVFGPLARYLAFVGSETARAKLVDAVARHPRGACRYHAYYAGTRYFATPPTPKLMRVAARSADQRLVALALNDLRYFGLPDARSLALEAAAEKVHRNDLAMALTEILATEGDAAAVDALLPLAELESATLRGRMQDLLTPVRDAGGVAVMAKGVSSRMEAVRELCAHVLAEIPTPEATRALADQLLKERLEPVALAIVKALARHGGAGGASAIVAAARKHARNEVLRRAILRSLADIGLEQEAVRRYFEKKLESNKWEERVLGVGAAARARAASLTPALIANLDHREWRVRLAVIQAFRRIRVKEAVQPLIERLNEEEKSRLLREIGETLYLLTGKQFYKDYELWARWWRSARDTFEVPARLKEAPARRGTRTVARFYGLPVDSERVVFVIDQSGSMSSETNGKSDYRVAVGEVLKVMSRLKRGARANVILFETQIHEWKKKLVAVTSSSRAALKRHLESNGPTGGTNLYDGLEMALHHKGVDTIFLLSDGMPHSGKFVAQSDIVREVRRINELKRITIHCVSLGRDSTLLKRLASENGGRYVRR